jgi:hypothetical protein
VESGIQKYPNSDRFQKKVQWYQISLFQIGRVEINGKFDLVTGATSDQELDFLWLCFHIVGTLYRILAAVSKDLVDIDISGTKISDSHLLKRFIMLEFKELTKIELTHNITATSDILFLFLSARKLTSFDLQNVVNTRFTKDEFPTVFNFLKAQRNLKTLILGFDLSLALMMKEFADAFDLQLEKLSIDCVDSADLLKFLRKQNTLKELVVYRVYIGHEEMQFFLNEMKSLKSLQITRPHFDVIDSLCTLDKNLTIEKIFFGYNSNNRDESNAPTIITLFRLNLLPNIKFVSFHGFTKSSLTEILLVLQTTAKKLEELEFFECKEIPSLEMKQLKRAKFVNCKQNNVDEFLKINEDIEETIN